MPTALWVGIIAAIALYGVWVFNRLVSLKVRAANAWSDIDVQLRRRSDLVPSLVQTVRGYAAHEKNTLEATIAARSQTAHANSPTQRGRVESQLGQNIAQIFALAEAYPDLKADEMFRSLHGNLVEIEDHIQSARRYYNAVVRDLNTLMKQFPHSIIAALFAFKPREFFELESVTQSQAPIVNLRESGPS